MTDALWVLHADGASNSSGCGAGLILSSPIGDVMEYALRFSFKVSNYQAEYEALLASLRIEKELNVRQLKVWSDSQLVVNQVKGDFEVRDATLALYLKKVQELGISFDFWDINHVPRTENSRADSLSRLATSTSNQMGRTFVEYLEIPSVSAMEKEKVLQIEPEMGWMNPIIKYLTEGVLLENNIEAKQIRKFAAQYVILDDLLYKKSFSQPLLKCLSPSDADYSLREVHEEIAGIIWEESL